MVATVKASSNNRDTRHTMCIDNRPPDHSQLGAAHLFTRTIDKRTALSEIESVGAVSVV